MVTRSRVPPDTPNVRIVRTHVRTRGESTGLGTAARRHARKL